jgi:dephospho-CoA kinase
MTAQPFVLGLTGSIGMGKSTTAGLLAAAGLPVWDADAAVHRLYAPGGAAVFAVARRFPKALQSGGIDRAALKAEIAKDSNALADLEALVHPLVSADRKQFLATARNDILVLDVPLLFETGVNALCDATLLVTAPPELQRARVLARPGMTEEAFRLILQRQLPDLEKRARATHILETLSLDLARTYVAALIAHIRQATHA